MIERFGRRWQRNSALWIKDNLVLPAGFGDVTTLDGKPIQLRPLPPPENIVTPAIVLACLPKRSRERIRSDTVERIISYFRGFPLETDADMERFIEWLWWYQYHNSKFTRRQKWLKKVLANDYARKCEIDPSYDDDCNHQYIFDPEADLAELARMQEESIPIIKTAIVKPLIVKTPIITPSPVRPKIVREDEERIWLETTGKVRRVRSLKKP